MARNLLLLLSAAQPPHPLDELRWHADRCAQGAKTALATTRLVSGLTRGESLVAFYADASLGNRLLGHGIFAGYARIDTPRGRDLLRATPLYSPSERPKGLRGMIELTDVRMAEPDATIEALNGIMEGRKVPLALANLPTGPARLEVYFLSGSG